MLPQKAAWSGLCFTPPKVAIVPYHLFIFGGTRACAELTWKRIWAGGPGLGEEVELIRNAWWGGFELLQQVVVSRLG